MSGTDRTLRPAILPMAIDGRRRAAGLTLPLCLLAAGLMLLAAVLASGEIGRFVDWPSLAIVLGGTMAIALASSDGPERAALRRGLAGLVHPAASEPAPLVQGLVTLAGRLRNGPLTAAEAMRPKLAATPILLRGLELAETGWGAEAVERALAVEIEARAGREEGAVLLLRRMAEVAPAMGLIGTLIGLVQMLGRLDDPARIGPAMALALLTTLYGAALAHGLFLPVAQRLSLLAQDHRERMCLEALAAVAISRRENPLHLMEQLACRLPAMAREDRP